LDTLEASGFTIPEYVRAKQADGEEITDNSNDIRIDSQANVWLSAVKLACSDLPAARRERELQYVYDAAQRYRILDEVKAASAFIEKMDVDPQQIRTEGDWQRTRDWLHKNAQYLDLPIREGIVDHLFEKAAELRYTLSLSEDCLLRQIAERDPVTPELQKLAEANIHKLATGKHYTTDQFEALPFEEVREFLPDLVKQASFEIPALQPNLFADAAKRASIDEAMVLDMLLQKHGQLPICDDSNLPVAISDAILAAL